MNDKLITLVTVLEVTKNSNGFKTGEKVITEEIFADIRSVGRAEHYEALSRGIRATIIFEVDNDDFELADRTIEVEGKTKRVRASKVIHEGIEYRIIRTYRNKSGMLELTCGEEE